MINNQDTQPQYHDVPADQTVSLIQSFAVWSLCLLCIICRLMTLQIIITYSIHIDHCIDCHYQYSYLKYMTLPDNSVPFRQQFHHDILKLNQGNTLIQPSSLHGYNAINECLKNQIIMVSLTEFAEHVPFMNTVKLTEKYTVLYGIVLSPSISKPVSLKDWQHKNRSSWFIAWMILMFYINAFPQIPLFCDSGIQSKKE